MSIDSSISKSLFCSRVTNSTSEAREEKKLPIVSLSLPDELLKSIEELQRSEGYAGRSELVRASIRLLQENAKSKSSLKGGQISVLLVITHGRLDDGPITKLKHEYQDIVKIHAHNQVSPNKCVELLLLEGDGARMRLMRKALRKEEKLSSVRFVVI